MDYKEMIESYAANGGDEKKMWASVEVTEEAMEYIKKVDPDMYECLMRKLSEVLDGKHYTESLALSDVAKIHYTNASGDKKHGAHWTVDEVESATASMTFPKGTTEWDKYVAFNTTYADLCSEFDDEQILKIAYLTWFSDEDWEKDGKIWDYMSMKNK